MVDIPPLEEIVKDIERIELYKSNILKIVNYLGKKRFLNADYCSRDNNNFELNFSKPLEDKYQLIEKPAKNKNIYSLSVLNEKDSENFHLGYNGTYKNFKNPPINIVLKFFKILEDVIKSSYDTNKNAVDSKIEEHLRTLANAIDNKK